MQIKKTVCLVSGGLDSAVAAAIAKNKGYELYFLFFDYNQKTLKKEEECFLNIADYLTVRETKIVKLDWFSEIGGTILINNELILTPENRRLEYVPFRNAIFMSYAVAWCEALDGDALFFGSTLGAINCPDNSPPFFASFQKLIKYGTKANKLIRVEVPLIKLTKAQVIKLGLELGVPLELTWSCHNFNDKACGHCSNCERRIHAFQENLLEDKIKYGDL